MSTTQELYTQSLLAQASYANLTIGSLNTDSQLTALKSVSGGSMAVAEANDFANKWTVVAQYDDPGISGLNVTIFENMASGTRYLAIRGTEPTDIGDLLTDATLAVFGISDDQYYHLRDKVIEWMSPDIDGNPSPFLPDANFIITGHSLGGYLAGA
jgi:hypothetical protein